MASHFKQQDIFIYFFPLKKPVIAISESCLWQVLGVSHSKMLPTETETTDSKNTFYSYHHSLMQTLRVLCDTCSPEAAGGGEGGGAAADRWRGDAAAGG